MQGDTEDFFIKLLTHVTEAGEAATVFYTRLFIRHHHRLPSDRFDRYKEAYVTDVIYMKIS